MTEDEKWERTKSSAKHFIAATVFNESSTETFAKTSSSLLPCIGYYYVGYHAGISMLWLCDSVPEQSLQHVRHGHLKKLIEINLIQTKKIDRSFLLEYRQLQDLREYANYYFGSKRPKYEYWKLVPHVGAASSRLLLKTIEFLYKELPALNVLDEFKFFIADDIGDDLVKLHCNKEVEGKVWDYLIKYRLTN